MSDNNTDYCRLDCTERVNSIVNFRKPWKGCSGGRRSFKTGGLDI